MLGCALAPHNATPATARRYSLGDRGRTPGADTGAGHVIEVREHQFLAATSNLEYSFTRQHGVANMLFGGTGFFVDRFAATTSEGVLWLHGYGNVFEKLLAPGEQIDVEPGGWIFRDESVRMDPQVYGLRTGIFGGSGQRAFNRFTGPGRVGIQSMYVHLGPSEDNTQSSRPGFNFGG